MGLGNIAVGSTVCSSWFEQRGGTCCFVYACANLVLCLGGDVADIDAAQDVAKCRFGSTICAKETVEYFGLRMEQTADWREVCRRGGILTIMHPLFNLHAVCAWPVVDAERGNLVSVVNSWLGPLQFVTEPEMLKDFLPPHPNTNKHWILMEKNKHV